TIDHPRELITYHQTRTTITLILSAPPPSKAALTRAALVRGGSSAYFFNMRSISLSRTISHNPSEHSTRQSPVCISTVNQSTFTASLSPRPLYTLLRSG